MIITLIKEETTQEYNKRMEKKYGSMEKLEKALEKSTEKPFIC
ncbi:hypothetical protein [Methanobrevibacter arboriphilus]|nr:hypothetical protein [Methanobrevibacter arboriphilus]